MASKFQPVKIINPTGQQKGTIFFFHGADDTGPNTVERIKELVGDKFVFPHLKIIFPTAPKRAYTAQGGEVCHVWFDRYASSYHVPEHKETLEQTCKDLAEYIKKIMEDEKLAMDQVIFGGYSMGGAMALHMTFRFFPKIAGVFTLSSFLNYDTKVYETIEKNHSKCPLFMAHGKQDNLIDFEWGYDKTFLKLKEVGVEGEFKSFEGDHELNSDVILYLKQWIAKTMPEDSKSN